MSDETIPIEKAKDYILAGNAVIIFLNKITGKSYKYKVKQDKENEHLWWVNTLINNPDTGRPFLVGTINNEYNRVQQCRSDWLFRHAHDYIHPVIQLHKDVFKAMWSRIVRGYWKLGTNEAETHEILHDGTCLRCGRPLTDPVSLSCGIGPECRKEMGIIL